MTQNKVSNGYEDISVEVIDYNQSIAEHVWNCYRMTWKSLQDVPYDAKDERVIAAVNNVIHMRALPMPREQAIITFRLNNISRVNLAQITRQQQSNFNIESQMPEPVAHNVILPLNIAESEFSDKAKKLIADSQELYDELIVAGYPPQDCRYLLMHGQTTSGVYVVKIDKFVGSFGHRCNNNLSDEINLTYRLMKDAILRRVSSDLFDGKIDRLTAEFYFNIISPADVYGAKQKTSFNYDRVFANSFDRYPASPDTEDIQPDYDFKKSAWYLELQRMDEKLLFDGEKEMIERWKK